MEVMSMCGRCTFLDFSFLKSYEQQEWINARSQQIEYLLQKCGKATEYTYISNNLTNQSRHFWNICTGINNNCELQIINSQKWLKHMR